MEDIEVTELEVETMASNIAKAKHRKRRKRAEFIEAMQEGTTVCMAPEDLQYGY